MKNLNLIVNQNEITQNGNEYLTSGGYKSIQCNFSFSEEWHNLTKTAIFVYNGVAFNETLVEDKCFIPHEAIENKGELSIGVFGTEISGENLEKRNTTDLLNVKIYEGSFIKGIQPEKPSPETWELYLEEVNKLIEEATNKIDSFTAEDIKFADGETFQEKYDNGEFAGGGSTTDENKFMKKEIYDINDNGIVDNSEKVNGHTVETDVPANAIFTDTTYDIATKTNNGLMSASDKQKLDEKVAELDEYGKIISSQLPSYVDDVVEATLATFPESGESGKIYVDIETNLSYRWTGTAYTVISPSIALGETSSTAYRGDRGKTAYEHSQETHAPINAQENIIENIKLDGKDLQVENKEINLNLEDNLVCVNSTEPTDNRKKVWLRKSKNLLNFSSFGTKTINGVTFTNNGNGTITINGNASASFGVNFVKFNLGAGTYHLSINVDTPYNFYIYDYDTNTNILSKEETVTLTKNYNNIGFDTYINSGEVFDNLTISPQLEVGSSASVFEENVTSAIYTKNNNDKYEKFSETVAISSHQPTNQNGLWLQKSKNLLKFDDFTTIINGITFTMKNQILSITGTATAYTQDCYIPINKTLKETETLTAEVNGSGIITKVSHTYNGTYYYPNLTTTTFEKDIFIEQIYFIIAEGTTVNATVKIQLEKGSKYSGWEENKDKKIYTKNDNGVYEEFLNVDNKKTLFENTEGDSSYEISMNDNVSNYSRIKVYGLDSSNMRIFNEVLNPASANFEMSSEIMYQGTEYISKALCAFVDNKFYKFQDREYTIDITASNTRNVHQANWLKITKIVGYY